MFLWNGCDEIVGPVTVDKPLTSVLNVFLKVGESIWKWMLYANKFGKISVWYGFRTDYLLAYGPRIIVVTVSVFHGAIEYIVVNEIYRTCALRYQCVEKYLCKVLMKYYGGSLHYRCLGLIAIKVCITKLLVVIMQYYWVIGSTNGCIMILLND